MQHPAPPTGSGKLQFRAFREQHFGPAKTYHWNQLFLPYGTNPTWRNPPSTTIHTAVERKVRQSPTTTHKVTKNRAVHFEKDRHSRGKATLSDEAIEIFRFSEAWKREKEQRIAEQAKEDREQKQTIFPESSAAHTDGNEPPATALVLSSSEHSDAPSQVNTLQHLVNFAYTESCPPDTVLWPVLPLRL
ncbi:unnamed protein product [Umbelopsis sp. WA50703]